MNPDYQRFRDEEARLIILRDLDEQHAGRSTETMLVHVLDSFGYSVTRDYVRAQIRKLKEIGAVTFSETGSVMIAQLTQSGEDHVHRRCVLEGVRRPSRIGG